MKAAKGEIAVFVDADCALAPEWLAIAVRELSQAGADVVGVQDITCLGVGYYMVRGRQLEPALSGSALVRWGGLGWPLLAVGKCAVNLGQVLANRRWLGARPLAVLPVLVVYEIALFIGGIGALLRLPVPRWA